jgi:hypothetical protein
VKRLMVLEKQAIINDKLFLYKYRASLFLLTCRKVCGKQYFKTISAV